MARLAMVSRILMGLVFFVFGLNGFFMFLPMPPMPEASMKFLGAMVETGYLFPLLKSMEVLCGALLLLNYFSPLALIMLTPIIVNIFLFHAFLAPSGLA